MKKLLIFGAFIDNKGAQSMLYTVIDKVKSKYPDCEVYVVREKKVNPKTKALYSFEFLEMGINSKLKLAGWPFSLLSKLVKKNDIDSNFETIKKIVDTSTVFIDISGFALSSKFTRNSAINYLANISLAKNFSAPIYLMPQSFGPFNYNFIDKPILTYMIKKYLRYPEKIYAREKEGYDLLSSLGVEKINKSLDLVFYQNEKLNLQNIYNNDIKIREVKIHANSVAIIPNTKTFEKGKEEQIYNIYSKAIKYLISEDKKVYLLRHSSEDLNIIENIYEGFSDNNKVHIIREEYSSIELQDILKKFDFIIASRYHSIVHSYKVGTPAIVLGWAVKYKELLEEFKQNEYQFDVNNMDSDIFMTRLVELNKNYKKEREVLIHRLSNIKNENVFHEILK